MLAIALGTTVAAGMLVRGYARFTTASYSSMTSGQIMYLSTSASAFTATAPVASGNVVRILGYCVANALTIYFNPDNTWVELV